MPDTVRAHTRKTKTGTVAVRRHTRRGPNPHHASQLAMQSSRASRRKRSGKAALLGLLAIGELAAWLLLTGTSLLIAAIAGILTFLSVLLTK